MKKIVTLLVLLAAIIGAAYYQSNQRNSRLNRASSGANKTRELLFPDFDINGIKKIRIKEDKQETTVTVKGDQWVVGERGGYPANKEKLQTALMGLKYEKIKAGRRIGKDSWGKIGVNSPGEATAFGVGTLVELLDEAGAVKHSFVLGGKVTSSGGQDAQMSMFGGGPQGNRFIRLKDDETIYEVANQFSDLENKPESWLLKDFIAVSKLKSIEVTAAKAEDSWKASKKAESDTDFVLEGAKPGEKLDDGKVTLSSFLSSPSFDDVLAKEKAAETLKEAVKAVLTTFDGFTYTIQAAKKTADGSDKWFMTVATTAAIPQKREAAKDEKPEDKKKKDEEFDSQKKTLEEKLAKEKACDGWVYQVSEYTINTLFKKRSEIIKKEEPTKDAAPAPTIPGVTPGTIPGLKPVTPPAEPAKPSADAAATSKAAPITVTTPPISVPPAAEIKDKPAAPPAPPKPELKPAETPASIPAVPPTPAAPAPAPAEPKK
jgi:hypothetical protein